MNIDILKEHLLRNSLDKTEEFQRLFHGRGNYYEDFNYLTVDSIDEILFASLFEDIDIKLEEKLINILKEVYEKREYKTLILQKRYLNKAPSKVIKGELKDENIVIENSLKYSINFSNKNIGIFPDMKLGREYIRSISKGKKVLNLFSYTCAFSVSAIEGEALKVVNIDMAKGALTTGRVNHRLNNHDTKKVKFLPYNILKSWSRIKKEGPYDIIVIDPPSFQKGSFAATKDYEKIIKRLDSLASSDCVVLSCLNAPELDCEFIKNIFNENAASFVYERRLENLSTFPCNDEEKTLKNLIFIRKKAII